jgi:pimeloyl-ACP methyl ester carboxylesterase
MDQVATTFPPNYRTLRKLLRKKLSKSATFSQGYVYRDVPLFYRISGPRSGSNVVLLHGVTMNADVWLCTQTVLSLTGYRVIAIDLRGHGRSGPAPTPQSMLFENLATDVAFVMQTLGIDQAAIVGWSLGGLVAQVFATTYPDRIEKLALVDTGPQGDATPDFPYAIDQASAQRVMTLLRSGHYHELATYLHQLNVNDQCPDAIVIPLRRWLESLTLQANFRSILDSFVVNGTRSLIPNLSRIGCPTLIVFGSRDLFYPPPAQLFMRLKIPNATLVEFPGKGHSAMLTTSSEFQRALIAFLSGTDRACDVCGLGSK